MWKKCHYFPPLLPLLIICLTPWSFATHPFSSSKQKSENAPLPGFLVVLIGSTLGLSTHPASLRPINSPQRYGHSGPCFQWLLPGQSPVLLPRVRHLALTLPLGLEEVLGTGKVKAKRHDVPSTLTSRVLHSSWQNPKSFNLGLMVCK